MVIRGWVYFVVIQVLGEAGVVKKVVSSKQVIVDMGKKTFAWHPQLLKLWAKGGRVAALSSRCSIIWRDNKL